MPFNGTTKRFDRIWQFVDQFIATANATRTDFDTTLNDVRDSLNAAITYLEGRDDSLSLAATDLRYIGSFSATPTTRIGGSALVNGDFYFDTDINEFLVYKGSAFVGITSLTTAMKAFLALIEADDDAGVRSAFGLGTASTQNSSAFATAAQGTKADSAVLAPSGLANAVTDWNTISAIESGLYRGAAGATNAPTALSANGLFVKTSATNGFLILMDSAGVVFVRSLGPSGWAGWFGVGVNSESVFTNLDTISDKFVSGSFANTATGAPSVGGTWVGLVEQISNGTIKTQRADVLGVRYVRRFDGAVWSAWDQAITVSHPGVADVLLSYNGSGTIKASHGVASVTRHAAGTYGISFSAPFLDTNYTALITLGFLGTVNGTIYSAKITDKTLTYLDILTLAGASATDFSEISVAIWR